LTVSIGGWIKTNLTSWRPATILEWPNAPSLIVSSRLADEHLCAEALNLGAFDVLAKPFNKMDVIRSV
jgi:DNA-binding response OmpR family regulator